MAVELINVGEFANDGTGDDLREAFIKINNNFEELDLRDDERTTASNLGNLGEGIFAQKVNQDLRFKKLYAGKDISLEANSERITISASVGMKRLLVQSDSGSIILDPDPSSNGSVDISINGGNAIETRIVNNVLTIDYVGTSSLGEDTNPTLNANLNANSYDISNAGTVTADTFVGDVEGNVTGLVHGVDIRDINQYFDNDLDFGEISQVINSIIEWSISSTIIDMGTIGNPELRTIDAGAI